MIGRLRSLADVLIRRGRFEREMDLEIRFHLEAYAADLMRSGVPEAEALRRARLEFGHVESIQEDCRQSRGLRFVDELRQDLGYGLRQLIRAPGFAVVAVVSLALGIGANTSIFTLVDAVQFRTLPVQEPQALRFLAHRAGTETSTSSSYPLFERYQASGILSGVTAYTSRTFTIATPYGLERVDGQYVSGKYHQVIGVPFALGRGFADEPDRPAARPPVAVISHGFWERRFGRDPDVIDSTLTVDGRAVSIIGVTAPSFRGLVSGKDADVTLPMFVRAMHDRAFLDARDGWTSLMLVGRLRGDLTEEQTLARVDGLFRRFWMEPENAWAREDNPERVRAGALLPAGKGSHGLRRQYGTPLNVLMAMVAIVLLIACGNVANLLLARAAVRSKEVAVRLGIGASRGRLVRQLLTESLLLALLGAALGWVMAMNATSLILSLFDTGVNPIVLDGGPNARILAFTIGVAALTAVGFGLLPALRATRVDVAPALKEGGVGTASRRRRVATGQLLVGSQIALCVVVVAIAGLLMRTMVNLRRLDTGFARENVVLFDVETGASLSGDRRASFYSSLLERLRAVPGVGIAAYARRSPLDFSAEFRGFRIEGFPEPAERQGVSPNVVTPEFFPALGIRIRSGRGFTNRDRAGAPNVALVSESMVRAFFGHVEPIGRTILMGANQPDMTVVGVVDDVRFERLRDDPPPMVYTPLAQPREALDGTTGHPSRLTVVISGSSDVAAIAPAARGMVAALSNDAIISNVRSMEQQLDAALVRERLLANLSGGFGALALLLAFVGLFGLMSYDTARRSREIGIRIALGATTGAVLRQILREAGTIAGVGIALGTIGALLVTRVVAAFLYGLSPRDPLTYAGVVLMLTGVALMASYLPARRAAATDPMLALRAE